MSLLLLPYTVLEVPRSWFAVPVTVLEPSFGATFLLVKVEAHCDLEAKRLSMADCLSLNEPMLKAKEDVPVVPVKLAAVGEVVVVVVAGFMATFAVEVVAGATVVMAAVVVVVVVVVLGAVEVVMVATGAEVVNGMILKSRLGCDVTVAYAVIIFCSVVSGAKAEWTQRIWRVRRRRIK